MANGYLGSSNLLTSTANLEIVPNTPIGWSNKRYSFYKFSFINKTTCRVKINGGEPIYLEENQGFESDKEDVKINSFIIVEPTVDFNWIGSY